jgi:methyl-accepting chemotaxis protein
MNMLNLSLRSRLLLAFGAVMVTLLIAVAIALLRLSQFNGEVHGVTNDRLPKLETTQKWVVQLLETARHTRNMLILDDKAKIKSELEAVAENKRLRAQYRDELSASVREPQERSVLQAVIDARTAYVPTEDEFLSLVSADRLKEAKETLLARTRPAQLTYLDKLEKLNDYEASKIKSAGDSLDTAYNSTTKLIGVVAAFAATIACAVAFFMTRAIINPIRSAVGVLGAIEAGRYDSPIPAGSRDETGKLLGALDSMQRNLKERTEREHNAAAENSSQLTAINRVQAVIEFELDGRIITANDNFLRATAYRLEEIRGQHHSMFVDPAYKSSDEYRRFWDKLARGEYDAGQYKRLGKGGRELWFEATYNPVVNGDGKPYKVVKYATDVTAQLAATRQMQETVRRTQDVVKAAGAGDLTGRLGTQGSGDLHAMSHGVTSLLQTMSDLISQIKVAAAEVHRGAEEISVGNANLSQRTEQQSSSLEETASSMEEMTATVKQNADNASQANQLAVAARDQAEKGGSVVGNAVRAMSGINDSSKKIADIIGVIDEIAFQTNLLALNAAVEAARAGEQGRGFAVVATEVRSLAGRSATAAKEIKALIQDSVRKVHEGSALVTQSGQMLELIVASVKKVTDIVGEIAAASREQSSGIEQVNKAVMQMDEMTQQNAALVEQSTAASQSMAEQARALSQTMERYRVGEAASNTLDSPAPRVQAAVVRLPTQVATKPVLTRPDRRSTTRPWNPGNAEPSRQLRSPSPPVPVA